MSNNDVAYRKSVRNMVVVIAVAVLVLAAALLIPPLINPYHEQFLKSNSVQSPLGFNLTVSLASTRITSGENVVISAWIQNTMNRIDNVSAVNEWPLNGLWTKPCTNGWPFGIGIMDGYFTLDNATSGKLLQLDYKSPSCPISAYSPLYFLIQPGGSRAIVSLVGGLQQWDLNVTISFGRYIQRGSAQSVQFDGVYTVVVADEWGDIALVHFTAA